MDGVFLAIGHIPNTSPFKDLIDLDEEGYVILEEGSTKTSSEGVFAAGDLHDKVYRQAITRSFGCMSALDAEKYIEAMSRLMRSVPNIHFHASLARIRFNITLSCVLWVITCDQLIHSCLSLPRFELEDFLHGTYLILLLVLLISPICKATIISFLIPWLYCTSYWVFLKVISS